MFSRKNKIKYVIYPTVRRNLSHGNRKIWDILCSTLACNERILLYGDALFLRSALYIYSHGRRVTHPADSSSLAYNSNKDEIYAFDTITEKIPIGSSCNSCRPFPWPPRRATSETASRACARSKPFARAPSITRLSGPRQVVTKFPAELTVRRVEMYKLSANVARCATN